MGEPQYQRVPEVVRGKEDGETKSERSFLVSETILSIIFIDLPNSMDHDYFLTHR